MGTTGSPLTQPGQFELPGHGSLFPFPGFGLGGPPPGVLPELP